MSPRRKWCTNAGSIRDSRAVPVAVAIADILLLDECSELGELEGQIRYLPLR